MSNIFPFTKIKSIVGENGSVVWANGTQSPLNFTTSDVSLTDSLNASYATAVDENETNYFSVLESSQSADTTLEEIHNITDNQKLGEDNESEHNFTLTETGEEQVVIFNVEGCDELYGIQMAKDEKGNVHKYQFQFRKTDDGKLEAMPETVQLLPNEETQDITLENVKDINQQSLKIEENYEVPVYLEENVEEIDNNPHLLLSIEEGGVEDAGMDEIYEEQDNADIHDDNMMVFIKNEQLNCNENDIDEEEKEEHLNIKEEMLLEEHLEYPDDQEIENSELDSHANGMLDNIPEEYTSEAESYGTNEISNEGEKTIIAYQNFDNANIETFENTETLDSHSTQVEEEHYEELFIEERHIDEQQDNLDTNEETTNVLFVEKESENGDIEDYEIVEGLPVTAEGEISEDNSSASYPESEIIYTETENYVQNFPQKEKQVHKTTNILKQPTNVNKSSSNKKKIFYYMVPNTDQKENVNTFSNAKSILKNNVEKMSHNEDAKRLQREKLLEKRHARSKEAIQAKMFNNFINKTTIPQAPVRQTRLPRKQEIKPVDTRTNEEIIVKEVMVSSKGFIESVSDRLNGSDKLEITATVELSDSDSDYDPKSSTKKKKDLKKRPLKNEVSEIIILQSDDESESSENNKVLSNKDDDNLKRTGGKCGEDSSPQKKSRTEESSEAEADSDNDKREISCPHCPKTFPSQNSLSTHIQHHNLENTLQNNKKNLIEYKHKCDTCQETFKNGILLKRHICKNKSAIQHICKTCTKSFKDVSTFNIHKKSHLKENLIKSTNTVPISPKKFLGTTNTAFKFKSPTKLVPSFKCNECSKVCSTQQLLLNHERTHKKFICNNCNVPFSSKYLLDSHVRFKCVKSKSPKDKKPTLNVRKSFINSPRMSSLTRRSASVLGTKKGSVLPSSRQSTSSTIKTRTSVNAINSEVKTRPSYMNPKKTLPKIEDSSPNKSILSSTKKRKPLPVHGGIPANDRLNKAFQAIRKNLIENSLMNKPTTK